MGKWMVLVKKAKSFVSKKGSKKSSGFQAVDNYSLNGDVVDCQPDKNVQKVEITAKEEEWITTAATPGVELEITIPIPSAELEKPSFEAVSEEAQELAAVKIQATFRGAMARKKFKACRRLQSALHGRATQKQTSNAMRCIQSFAKLQSQVRIQRARMNEFQIQQRKEQDEARKTEEEVEDWDDSILSKEQIHARIRNKRQAAAKRERTLAYAFSHQLWRSYPKNLTPAGAELEEKPVWSWSWLEQWMTKRTWECLDDDKQSVDCANPVRRNKWNLVNGHTIPRKQRLAKVHSHEVEDCEQLLNGCKTPKRISS